MPNSKKLPPANKQALLKLYRQGLAKGVNLDKINQKVSKMMARDEVSSKIEDHDSQDRVFQLKKQLPWLVRTGAFLLPVGFISIGVMLLFSAIAPISSYYLNTLPQLAIFELKTPIPRDKLLDITPAVIASTQEEPTPDPTSPSPDTGPVIINTKLDYTNLANWFDEDSVQELADNQSETLYTLEIPKLNISEAEVKIGGTNLDESLIQYPGTADPGRPGSPVIFGHSVLRQFYNPSIKNPRRYNSIFSTIMTLQNGDEIYLTKDGVKYTYKVEKKTEVKPEDVYILGQNYDNRKLKLVTCVPEGTYLRRGVVQATLVE
jgi:LPXTG-site transpeptidase (sortase) family protein